MSNKLSVSIVREGKWYVARALELGVVSQGRTVDEARANLREAVELYFEDKPSARREAAVEAPLFTTIEV